MSKRILQVCPHDSAPFGDLLALYAKAASQLGVEVVTLYLAPPSTHARANCEYLNLTRLADTKSLAKALKPYVNPVDNLSGNTPWDLVVCHRYRSYWGCIKAGFDASKIIAVAHEYKMLAKWQRRLARLFRARSVRFAGVSEPVATELAQTTGHHLVLPNALDTEQDRERRLDKSQALSQLGFAPEDDVYTIAVIGRLHYKKRPMLALKAFTQFNDHHRNSRLVYVGAGPEELELSQQGLDNVHLLGNVERAKDYVAAFDAILYPAVADSFGMVVLEAMDAGIPVVCTKQHGPAYVLGELGCYAEQDTAQGFADALLKQYELRPDMLENDILEHTDTQHTTALQRLKLGQQRTDEKFSVEALKDIFRALLNSP